MLAIRTGTDLVYNIVEGHLSGIIDGMAITAYAGSGGRAGSKTLGVVNPLLANNPYATHVKLNKSTPGGPLVMGKYHLATHENKPNWIRLLPFPENQMEDRVGFAIHGRGTRGSDGCIVPTDFNVVQTLYRLVQARENGGQPAPTLAVIAIGDLNFWEKKMEDFRSTA